MLDRLGDLERVAVPATQAELLERIPVARVALDETVATIDADALATRPDDAGWTAVDHLAHIAAWERMIVAHLTDESDAAIAGVDPVRYAAMTLQEINDALHERTSGRPASETVAEYRLAHEAIVAFLAGLPERAFSERYWADADRTVMEKVTGDTYRHYLEHRRWILELHRGPS